MANSRQIETALLTEHLRYTPLTIIDDVINTVNLLVARAVDAVESGLLSADPETLGFAAKAAASNQIPDIHDDGRPHFPEMKAEIEEGVHKLETLLATNVDRNFDKFEIFALRNIFSVDESLVPWVRLEHYEGVDFSRAGQDQAVTPESARLMRRKLQETRKLNSALLAERARNEVLLSQLRALVLPPTATKTEPTSPPHEPPPNDGRQPGFSFLTSSPSAQALGMRAISPDASAAPQSQQPRPNPLETNTSFALAQLPSLRALLAELRPRLQNLGATTAGAQSAGHGRFARERGEYVETQTMRILERRGVDLHDEEEDGVVGVRSEDGLVTGRRRVGKDEVEALEKIVAAFSGRDEGGGRDRGRGNDNEVQDDDDAMEE